jgi:5-deoxy-glucuronate isomerase
MSAKLHLPAGSTADGWYAVVVSPEDAGWGYSGLRVLELPAGGSHRLDTGADEVLALPLAGSCAVAVDGERFELSGRSDVFSGVTDFAYLPRDAEVTVTSRHGARVALPSARARRRLEPRYVPASEVPVELRGAGSCSRQVNNFCTPESFAADRLIACEVLTPGGNWSSYPPHKHDQQRRGEAELEEIYYFEIRPEGARSVDAAVGQAAVGQAAVGDARGGAPRGIAYQRVYGTADRPLDLLAEVRTGDLVLIPHGGHGPSKAAPGYDLDYLNVMAGPGAERAWLICDDPAHAWVRATWRDQAVDPRLPLTSRPERRPS